ncbi:aspartate/tyrosine/aromatic aminotransferase [Pelomicrobium methylotrophicum]|uniref:Aminotransferase n=2 Tax=Pelomicrobium methylotrophicum TaxID=2602750 RepID=A0A5C7F2T9_9PROT|nr:aspartate/tyrosine/aromatic aminotransferase [Pelomicrobium methylotrophicum]
MAPRDPILGLNELFNADKNPAKVNLGVGVYYDDTGKVPLLECVRLAERQVLEQASPRNYLPIDGLPAYDRMAQTLVFGADNSAANEGRVVTLQTLGGTGALKVGADFLRRIVPGAQVWISNPSWENHRALFESAGFTVNTYPYYDPSTHGVDFPGMMKALNEMPAHSIVVLHACCHNPTGVDLTTQQWDEVIAAVRKRALIPFLDIAYQGFGEGLDADALAVRRFAGSEGPLFVSSSFSKSFSLYGERVGALSVVTASSDEAARVLSQLKRVVRTNYSNPPTHGGRIVTSVLTSPDLRALWEQELGQMRERIRTMRNQLVEKIHARVPGTDLSFVARQRGMFSYSGLSKEAVRRLREEFSVYAVDTGRICVAALNSRNIDYVADAIAQVIR